MAFLKLWNYVNDIRTIFDIPDKVEFDNLKERVDNIAVEVPYFQQAFQVILFSGSNTRNYPQTRNAIQTQDQIFQNDGSYVGLTEGQKAQLLIDALYE